MSTPPFIQDDEAILPEVHMSDIDLSSNQVFDLMDAHLPCENIQSIHNDGNNKFQIHFLREIELTDIMSNSDEQPIPQTIFRCHPVTTTFDQFQSPTFPSSYANLSQTMDFSNPPSGIDSAILRQSISLDQDQPTLNALVSNRREVNNDQSETVAPILYHQNTNTSQGQIIRFKSTKIQIKCQPRDKFRPRTQNESKTSSHYLRCEQDAQHEHPTIYIPQEWTQQSDSNIIEVALVNIEKQPHPYILENKTRLKVTDDIALVFKENDPNTLYFRLTNEDFVRGFKTFMIEFIKSRQDETITKTLIRQQTLEQSMLRFTRYYRDVDGKYKPDTGSVEYSCIMTENYGDVSVEHMGPRFGPMVGQEMIFIVMKGRFIKKDIAITITEPTSNWSFDVQQFSTNGGLICFPMPSFPYPQLTRVNATIHITCKQDSIYEGNYLYTSLLDQELNECNSDAVASPRASQMNQVQFEALSLQSSASRRLSKAKLPKRLDGK